MNKSLKVNVIGLGYIGLPTAAILAKNAYDVLGIDINNALIKKINQGEIKNIEPGLDDALNKALSKGYLKASSNARSADVHIICVPTPIFKEGSKHAPDLSYVYDAVNSLAPYLKNDDLLIIESTISVGTSDEVSSILENIGIEKGKIHIAHCPERVIPGNIMEELVNNDRIVGGLTDEATNLAVKFYESFVNGKVIKTNARTAELCKLSENSFRDINIAFANELSIICDKENIDAWELINLANRHPRVNILQPSVGVGGHCIAVDPWFIVSNNEDESKIIQTARQVNMSKTDWVIKKIYSILESKKLGNKKNITIGCLGVTFKPDVDDIRESPALRIVKELISSGNEVMVADPNVIQEMPFKIHDSKTVIQNADILVFLVKHKEFVELRNSGHFNKKIVLDFCGAFKI